ncbi:hypothetical protein [Paenibacillus sp. GYB003]|uniref:hypothetical protein n=1 Tax=Paenibacillus sp. GYB003 TaxID=2994392 RepID=UPI002F962747
MNDNVGFLVALLLGAGFWFIRKAKRRTNGRTARTTGYALLAMSIFLVLFVVIGYLSDASHGYGH